MEGIVRSISKQVYGKGPRDIHSVCQGNVYVIHCFGVLSPLEARLADQGGDGRDTLARVRQKIFAEEREMITQELEAKDIVVETILQDFCCVKDERILVIVTKE